MLSDNQPILSPRIICLFCGFLELLCLNLKIKVHMKGIRDVREVFFFDFNKVSAFSEASRRTI